MKSLKSTIGFVGSEGVMLKDDSIFKKGEMVLVLSTKNFHDFFNQLNEIKKELDKSKDWIDEIEQIKNK